MRYYLNLGSNLGDPMRNITRALAALSAGTGGCIVTPPIVSQPWGFRSENTFVNLGVAVDTGMTPRQMLRFTQSVERRLGSGPHRNPDGSYADRLIDIDIMAADGPDGKPITVNTDNLTIPHPHLHGRDFFLIPYRQLRKCRPVLTCHGKVVTLQAENGADDAPHA